MDFPSVTCVLGAMFALNALLLAALLTVLLGLAPTPQSLLRAGAGTAGATSVAIVHPARGIRQRPPAPAGLRRPHGGSMQGTSRVAASLLALGVGCVPPVGRPRQLGIPSS